MANQQSSALLMVDSVVYAYLDLWPFGTYNLVPFDSPEDPVTWARIGLLLFSGFFVTLFSPRPARLHKSSVRHFLIKLSSFTNLHQNEDTVPLLSRILYTYLDRVVFHAWRIPSLGLEDIPEISEQYESEALRRKAFPVGVLLS